MSVDERTHSERLIRRYSALLKTDLETLKPVEVLQVINRVSHLQTPETSFPDSPIPPYLQELYTQARIAKDNYYAGLADHITESQTPNKESNTNRIRMMTARQNYQQ